MFKSLLKWGLLGYDRKEYLISVKDHIVFLISFNYYNYAVKCMFVSIVWMRKQIKRA